MTTRREAEGIGASRKRRRQTAKKPSAALYIGYSEDSESIESIMAKFAAVEQAKIAAVEQAKKGVTPGNATACDGEERALTEEELKRALQVDDSDVPLDCPVEQKVAPRKGSLVERLGAGRGYEPLDDYVPCEVDADEAQRVMQKIQYPTDDVPERRLSKALGRDLFEADLYGIDAYTFSQVLTAVSESEGSPGLSAADAVHFTERMLLPLLHLRAVGLTAAKCPEKAALLPSHVDAPAGRNKEMCQAGVWLDVSLKAAAGDLLRRSSLEDKWRTAAAALQERIKASPADFQVHPKGVGLICVAPGGFSQGEYLGDYLGEVFPPWRWCEREDAGVSVKKEVRERSMPVFYNMLLETPTCEENRRGYDVVWIDAKFRGNVFTRCSHSCAPNVTTSCVANGGRFAVSLFAKTAVRCGEEVTFDYNCRTDSRAEMEESICLCGSSACRGSYLSFYDDDQNLQAVVEEQQTSAHTTAMLLLACQRDALSAKDEAILNDFHMPSTGSVLGDAPVWLQTFAASVLRFVQSEKEQLRSRLAAENAAEAAAAAAEAATIADTRLQSLAITVDKVKYLLRQQPVVGASPPPLRRAEPEQVMSALWQRKDAQVRRLVAAMKPQLSAAQFKSVTAAVASSITSLAQLRENGQRLEALATLIAGMASGESDRHTAAADLLRLYAQTETFFVAHEYAPYTSPFVQVGHTGGRSGVLHQRKYGSHEVWAMLASWHKETSHQPVSLLNASIRSMHLPNVERCYAAEEASQAYQRDAVLGALREGAWFPDAGKLWPLSPSNSRRVELYGTPAMDQLLIQAAQR